MYIHGMCGRPCGNVCMVVVFAFSDHDVHSCGDRMHWELGALIHEALKQRRLM